MPSRTWKDTRRADLLALVSGALLPLAFAPFEFYPLAVLAPAVLLGLWLDAPAARAARHGLLFGLGQFGVGGSWIYVAMHGYGNMQALLAALVVVVFISYLASYQGLLGWTQARLFKDVPEGRRLLLLVPALWTIADWLRAVVLSGFTWLQLGYSQIDAPLSGYAPGLGVYAVTFATVLSAGLLVWLARAPHRRGARALALAAALWLGGWLAGRIEWTEPAGEPLRVALIQGNIPLAQKWLAQNRYLVAERYARMSFELDGVDLVLWPESAIPAYRDELEAGFFQPLAAAARARHMDFLLGTVEREQSGNQTVLYNSAVAIGGGDGVYRKRHLVPLGEFLPLAAVSQWVFRTLEIPMSDFSSGPGRQPPIALAGQKIGVSICYEAAFGEEVIDALPEATLLANLSEDAWFGDSLGPHQHLQMARMRARETERPLLRATNSGISAIVDARGALTARSAQFRTEVIRGAAQPRRGVTPYGRLGNYPMLLLSLLVALFLRWETWRRRGSFVLRE